MEISSATTTHASVEGVDMYSNCTLAVSLVNSAGLESELALGYYIGRKHSGPKFLKN